MSVITEPRKFEKRYTLQSLLCELKYSKVTILRPGGIMAERDK